MHHFTNDDRALLHAIWKEIRKMALDFSKLQDAVSQLSTDVQALIAMVPNDAANQATIDAVTSSLSALDAAVKTAETPPATG